MTLLHIVQNDSNIKITADYSKILKLKTWRKRFFMLKIERTLQLIVLRQWRTQIRGSENWAKTKGKINIVTSFLKASDTLVKCESPAIAWHRQCRNLLAYARTNKLDLAAQVSRVPLVLQNFKRTTGENDSKTSELLISSMWYKGVLLTRRF